MQNSQISFSQAEYAKKRKTTRREAFLEKMEHLVRKRPVCTVLTAWRDIS